MRSDAFAEITRHRRLDAFAARQHPDFFDIGGEIDRRLARRVSRADQRDFLSGAEPRLDRRGPIVNAGAFELREVGYIEAAIARAARDDHRARLQPFVVADIERVVLAVFARGVSEPLGFVRYHQLGAELLRLIIGARHQRPSRDTGGKAEIIFDARGGARLPAEGAAIQHDDGQSLRRGVNRRRQSRRARTDDRHVVELRRIDRPHQADAARQLVIARIAQQFAVRAKHDRQVMRIDMKALDQRLRTRIGR